MDEKNSQHITIALIIEKLKELIKEDPQTAIYRLLAYGLLHYDELTQDAQKHIDNLEETVLKVTGDAISKLPESPEKRKALRLHRGATGKRLMADSHIGYFENPVKSENKIADDVKVAFRGQIQYILDFYQDILKNTLSGTATFSKVTLLGACITELLVTFHLSQRHCAAQALSHIRTIHEALDLIDLFNKEPDAADLWMSDKPSNEVWDKLKPSKVKARLKKDGIYWKLYNLFSDLGTHPSFNMMRTICRKSMEKSEKGNPQFLINITGSPKTKEAIFTHIFLLMATMSVLGALITTFGKRLDENEIKEALGKFGNDLADISEKYLIKPIKDAGGTVEGLSLRESLDELMKKMFTEPTVKK